MDQREKYLKQYELQFSGLKPGNHHFDFKVDKTFFDWFEATDIENANIDVAVEVDKKSTAMLVFKFALKGTVTTACDRCLEALTLEITSNERLIVKFGEEESEDDDIIVLPESAWLLNTAQYIYEFAMLAIPLRKVHELDACDPLVIEKLTEIQLEEEPQVEEDDIDPRWSALKNLN